MMSCALVYCTAFSLVRYVQALQTEPSLAFGLAHLEACDTSVVYAAWTSTSPPTSRPHRVQHSLAPDLGVTLSFG